MLPEGVMEPLELHRFRDALSRVEGCPHMAEWRGAGP